MAFPNLLKRLFDSNGAGVKLNGGIMPYSTSSPKAASTASPGTSDTVARGDHIHPAQTAISGNAGTATKLKNKHTIDGVQFDGSANVHHYGSCSTAAGTAEKAVTLAGFTLATGARITVRFTVTNTAANPTLNVNSTGAKPIQYRNAAISAGYLAANRVYEFVYDGAAWELVGDINTDTNTTYGAATTTTAGLVKVGTNISVSGGTISVANGSTTRKGVVQLSSATNSTSTTLAATASAVKAAYDKGASAATAAGKAQTAATAAQSAADAAAETANTAKAAADAAQSAVDGVAKPNAYVTATWRSGPSWYRKWSNGFIEQGGTATTSGASTTISLHTPFTSTSYTVAIGEVNADNYLEGSSVISARATANFTIKRPTSGISISWYAAGY